MAQHPRRGCIGVYAFYDYDKEPIYVGQTWETFGDRIGRHLTGQRSDVVANRLLDPFEVSDVANGWEDVERFDCCHGCCHLHQDGRDGNDPLWQLDDEKDVPEAFVRACDQAETRARIIRNKGKDVKK